MDAPVAGVDHPMPPVRTHKGRRVTAILIMVGLVLVFLFTIALFSGATGAPQEAAAAGLGCFLAITVVGFGVAAYIGSRADE